MQLVALFLLLGVGDLSQSGLAAIMIVYALLSLTLFHFAQVMLFVGKAAAGR